MEKNFTGNHVKNILSLPPGEAENEFNSLPLEQQMIAVFNASWEERQKLILLSENAPALVQGMPYEEFFWTVKASGPSDSLPLIAMAHPDQLQFMFDMDWWKKDIMEPGKIMAWFLLITEAGDECLERWLHRIRHKDDLLLPAALAAFLDIQKRPDDMEMEEARNRLHPFTLDNDYWISFSPERMAPLLTVMLQKIFGISGIWYRDIMENILEMTSTELMEEEFRRKTRRLEDEGIPGYFDSLSIYAPVTPGEVERQKVVRRETPVNNDSMPMPVFVPTLYMADYPLLNEAVNELAGAPVMERIIREWTGVSNKLIMAWNVDLDDPDLMKKAVLAASALINTGLDIMSRRSGRRPAHHLAESALENLVRLAVTAMKQLSSRAKKLFRAEWTLRYMPEPWTDMARGLLKNPPLVWDEKSMEFLHVKSSLEIERLSRFLDQAEKWLILLEKVLPPCSSWERAINWEETNYENDRGFTWKTAMATLFVNCITGEGAFMVPIKRNQLEEAIRMLADASSAEAGTIQKAFMKCMDGIPGESLAEEDMMRIFRDSVEPFLEELKGAIIYENGLPDDYANSRSILLQKS